MNKAVFVLYFLLLYGFVPAVAQQTKFTKVFYDPSGSAQAYTMIKTSGNNYIIAGYKDYMPFAMMLDPQGNVQWGNSYGSDDGKIFSIAETNDSGFILAGYITPSGSTQDDILLVRITTEGDTVWSKTIDMGYIDKVLYVMRTNDNGFLITGYSRDSVAPFYRAFIIKLNVSGNLSWERTFYKGSYLNYACSAAESSDGNFLVTGSAGSGPLFSGGLLLMKLNSAGAVIWSKNQPVTFPGSSSGNDLKILPDGILCYFTDINSEMALLKTDLSGNVLWCKSVGYGGINSDDLPSAKMHHTSDGGYIFVNGSNQFYPMGIVVKVDSVGEAVWARNLFLLAVEMVQSHDSGYIIAGNGPIMGVRMANTDNPQIGIIKLDSSGYSTSCVDPYTPVSTPYPVTIETVTLTTGTAGIIQAFHPQVTQVTLSADTGCVAFIGGIGETVEANPLKVIPNPSNGIFRLELNRPDQVELCSIEVYNAFGEMVFISSVTEKPGSDLNLSFLPDGIYEIRAVSVDKALAQKLIIVR